jgi:hypothetical protein
VTIRYFVQIAGYVFAAGTVLAAVVHVVCLGLISHRISSLPEFDELFRKNPPSRRGSLGHSLRSEFVFSQPAPASLESADARAFHIFELAQMTARIAAVLVMLACLCEVVWLLW